MGEIRVWRRCISAAAATALLGCSAVGQIPPTDRLPTGLDDAATDNRIYFTQQDYAQFRFFVVDSGWLFVARQRLEPVLAAMRENEELRALLDDDEKRILDRVQLKVGNTDQVVWSSNVVGGQEVITVSYGSVWFLQQFAASMWNMLYFDDYRFLSLYLLSEKGLSLGKSRRWYAANPYIAYKKYDVPTAPPAGFDALWEGVQEHMLATALLHELCHLFDGTTGPAKMAKLKGLSQEESLKMRRSFELRADRCAARLMIEGGGNPEAGLAMVLATTAVWDEPATSTHPASSERVAHLSALGDASVTRMIEKNGVSRKVAEDYRDLIRRLGAIYAHVYKQKV